MNGRIRRLSAHPYVWILLLIVVVGAALRYFGIPNAENTDEYNEVIEALRIASGNLNYERWWKKGYQNILAVAYGVYFSVGYILNQFAGPWDFAAKIVRNMEPLFLIGRYITATLGIASIVVLFTIGRKLFGHRAGLIAASMFAVESINVWTSHLVNTDVPLTFFFLLSLYFSTRLYQEGKVGNYVAAAFFAAYAVSIKMIGVGACVALVLFHLLRYFEQGDPGVRLFPIREIGYAALAFAAGMIAGNPALVVGIDKFIMFHYGVYTNVYNEVPYAQGGSGYGEYASILLKGFGWPMVATMAAAMVYSVVGKNGRAVVLALYVGIMFLLLGGTTFLVQDRYLMILFPGLFLLVGKLIDDVACRLGRTERHASVFCLVATGALLITPVQRSVAYVKTLTDENTSVVSRRWIESNIPPGSKLLVDAGRTIITFGPRLNQSREKLEEQMNVIKALKEGQTFDSPLVRIVDSYAAVYFELLLRNLPDVTYHITSTELGRNVELPRYYKEAGFDYYVYNSTLDYRTSDPLWREKYPKSAQFYDTFRNHFTLVQEFSPSKTRSGSVIAVYKIQ